MNLTFVTANPHKVKEIGQILLEYGIEIKQKKKTFLEPSFSTLEEIALEKARAAFKEFKEPLIVEDVGLYFKAYKNFPGTQPKRVFESIGFDGIFRLLRGKDTSATFKSVICYMNGLHSFRFFTGEMHGKIVLKVARPKSNAMVYDKIFIPKGYKKRIVEMSLGEKNKISHRAIATRKLGEFLQKNKNHHLDQIIESLDF